MGNGSMDIRARRCELAEVTAMRDLYRQELNCQIRHDSMLPRGLADPYLLEVQGRVAGYGAVLNRYDPGHLTEFYTLPHRRALALPLFRALLAASGATHIEAQTNSPLQLMMLWDCGRHITCESILFADAERTDLRCPGAVLRRALPGEDTPDPSAGWVLEVEGVAVAAGGFLLHYNPPYADIHMTVAEPLRRRGYGSYLVQELKRACYEAGRRPAARCHPDNSASRRTLERAGLLPCGRVLLAEVTPGGA